MSVMVTAVVGAHSFSLRYVLHLIAIEGEIDPNAICQFQPYAVSNLALLKRSKRQRNERPCSDDSMGGACQQARCLGVRMVSEILLYFTHRTREEMYLRFACLPPCHV